MTVAEVLKLLADMPPEAEVMVERGGAYDEVRLVEYAYPVGQATPVVFISSNARKA